MSQTRSLMTHRIPILRVGFSLSSTMKRQKDLGFVPFLGLSTLVYEMSGHRKYLDDPKVMRAILVPNT